MKVQRPIYLETLKHKMHNGLVKVITGIRRCGKSYLLSVLFGDYLRENGVDADHIIEIPLDRDEFRELRDPMRLGEYVRSKIVHDGKWNYVFIDEIQLSQKVLPADIDLSRIAPEDRESIFKFFTKVDDLSQGLGLGLPLSKRHAQNLGGDLTLDTDYQQGCRFILEIPCQPLNLG